MYNLGPRGAHEEYVVATPGEMRTTGGHVSMAGGGGSAEAGMVAPARSRASVPMEAAHATSTEWKASGLPASWWR